MVISYNSVMEVLTVLCQERKLMVTVTESGKGALVTGGIAGLGGLLLGPLGLALGGAVGGCIAAWQAHGNFKPVMEVILYDLRQDQRERMVESVREEERRLGHCQNTSRDHRDSRSTDFIAGHNTTACCSSVGPIVDYFKYSEINISMF